MYGSQLQGQTNVTSLDKMQKHQNRAPRKNLFKKHQDSISHFSKELKFLNFLTFPTGTNKKVANSSVKHFDDNHNLQLHQRMEKFQKQFSRYSSVPMYLYTNQKTSKIFFV